jgi:hypothetical protein
MLLTFLILFIEVFLKYPKTFFFVSHGYAKDALQSFSNVFHFEYILRHLGNEFIICDLSILPFVDQIVDQSIKVLIIHS